MITAAEWNLLRQTLTASARLSAPSGPAATPMDWQRVYRFARDNDLAPLLARPLADLPALPQAIRQALTADYYAAQANSLILQAEGQRVLQKLSAAGIEAIVLKGLALNVALYAGARPMGDIDLLVHRADIGRAARLLESLGYIHKPTGGLHPRQFDEQFGGQVCLETPVRPVINVDLQWDFFGSEWVRQGARVEIERLWTRRRALILGDLPAWQLGLTDTLLHLCLHTAQHVFFVPRSDLDIYRLVEREADAIDWDEFLALTRRYRMRVMVYLALTLNGALWQTPIPERVRQALAPGPLRRWLLARLLPPALCREGAAAVQSLRGRYLLHLLWLDGWPDLVRVLRYLFFPGPEWLQSRYQIIEPAALRAAAVWHPLRVLRRGFQAIAQVFFRP